MAERTVEQKVQREGSSCLGNNNLQQQYVAFLYLQDEVLAVRAA